MESSALQAIEVTCSVAEGVDGLKLGLVHSRLAKPSRIAAELQEFGELWLCRIRPGDFMPLALFESKLLE